MRMVANEITTEDVDNIVAKATFESIKLAEIKTELAPGEERTDIVHMTVHFTLLYLDEAKMIARDAVHAFEKSFKYVSVATITGELSEATDRAREAMREGLFKALITDRRICEDDQRLLIPVRIINDAT